MENNLGEPIAKTAIKLDMAPDFIKDGIDYIICSHCYHFNGMYEDTEEFYEGLYTEIQRRLCENLL